MTTDEQPVASSATPDPTPAPVEPKQTVDARPTLDRLTTEERSTWRKTGKLPDVQAASSTATPEKAVSTETTSPPASEPGTPKPKKNAESRKVELEAEIQALLTKRAQLRQEVEAPPRQVQTPAASSPAPVAEKFPSDTEWLAAHPEMEYGDYIDARARFVYTQEQQAHERRQSEVAAAKESAERLKEYRKSAETFVADHADYWQVIQPVTSTNMPQPLLDAVDHALARSGYSPQLLYHLGTHLDEFETLISLPPAQAAYELGQLAARLTAPAPPVVKTLSTAPDPPPTLRSKPATPVDDLEAAIKSGDFTRYKLAANKRAVSGR